MISKPRISIFLFLILSLGLFKQVGICKSIKVNPKHSYHQTLIPTSKPISLQGVPLFFEMNNGQFDPAVKFKAKNKSYSLYLTDKEAVIRLRGKGSNQNDGSVLRLQFKDINPNAKITGVDRFKGIINYYLGKDPKKWHTNVPTYAKVKYEDIYPGIDLIFYGNKGLLEYDLEVRPGADPSQIKFECLGQNNMQLNGTGDLALEVGDQKLRIRKPYVYQKIKDKKINISASFDLHEDYISFQLASFDSRKTLIIDPILEFSTYLGGTDTDESSSIAVDNQGNYYITGFTRSDEFPLGNPYNNPNDFQADAFVAKINSSGDTMEYLLIVGGSIGEIPDWGSVPVAVDIGSHIKVDEDGAVYVSGTTNSPDFPITGNAFDQTCGTDGQCDYYEREDAHVFLADIFVMKISTIGEIVYSTYIGGGCDDSPSSMDIDDNHNVYIATTSGQKGYCGLPYPTTHTFDKFGADAGGSIVKLNTAGSDLIYLSHLGLETIPIDISVNETGEIYLTGQTRNVDFPASENAFQRNCAEDDTWIHCNDVIFMKLNSSCDEIIHATFIGGNGVDIGEAIALDHQGHVFMAGRTSLAGLKPSSLSTDFPLKNAFQTLPEDLFILKYDVSNGELIFSSYLGGDGDYEKVTDMVVNDAGNAYFTGWTQSNTFPFIDPLLTHPEEYNAYVCQVDPSGNLTFSSFLGGHLPFGLWPFSIYFGEGMAINDEGEIVIIGSTESSDFPLMKPFQNSYGGGDGDVFISKLSFNDTFMQDDATQGLLCIEAEHYSQINGNDTHQWKYDDTPGFSGVGAMVTHPNDNTNIKIDFINNSPSLSYKANFVKTGRHYVWVRGFGPDSGSDSLHIGLDGIFVDSSDNFKGFEVTGDYSWSDSFGAYIDIETPSLHTIDIYMRESGFIFDKILLTTSSSFTPTGLGPDESGKYAEPIVYDIDYLGCISEQCTTTLMASAHDPAGGVLTYAWDEFDDGSVDGTGDSFVFDPPGPSTPPACDPYLIKLTVTSGASGLSTEEIVEITVKLAGDANGDGVVNILDKVMVRNAFGSTGPNPADVNCDDVVNILDKVVVRNQFGQSGCACP